MVLSKEVQTTSPATRFDIMIKTWDLGNWLVISPFGELDIYNSGMLRDHIARCLDQGKSRMVLDLRGVDFLDSDGLGALVGGLKRARASGGDLRLVAEGPQIMRMLQITGLTDVFKTAKTVAAVIEKDGPAAK